MADTATTADRMVAVYCGPGGPVDVPCRQGTLVKALYDSTVDKLRADGRAVSASQMVLWRVSREDVKKLRHGDGLSDTTSKVELDPEDVIADDTLSPDHRIWVQLLGGNGAWGAAAGCTPWGGALAN
jgi:hypothetical protein